MKCVESNLKAENNGASNRCLCNLQVMMEHAQSVLNEYQNHIIEKVKSTKTNEKIR